MLVGELVGSECELETVGNASSNRAPWYFVQLGSGDACPLGADAPVGRGTDVTLRLGNRGVLGVRVTVETDGTTVDVPPEGSGSHLIIMTCATEPMGAAIITTDTADAKFKPVTTEW